VHIIVTIKQVPETDKVKMDPETGTMVRSGLESIVNPLDLYAIEEALVLKERFGVKVGLNFPVLVGFNFPVSDHHSKPTAPTRRRSFMR
jgi:hypothetical protein